MRSFFAPLILLVIFSTKAFSQQLIINEVSQGTQAKEYVEFIVAGNPTCQIPVPCMDLRGVILDDNNGDFANGSGTGIAPGAVRFANTTFWSCIPQGTLILIYNNNDLNPAIPPNDISMDDGNCRLIIPINSNLFEGQSDSPTSSNTDYPPSGTWIAGGGDWSQVAMSNSNDSFQILTSLSNLTSSHGVSWGNNTTNTFIYFTDAGGKVFSMMNSVDNDPFEQANWAEGTVGVNETPGQPNNSQNEAWISGMNPNCGVGPNGIQIELAIANESCPADCDGEIVASVFGGTSPYSYDWNNGADTPSISGLCQGDYSLTVTDDAGCTAITNVTILAGTAPQPVSITTTGPFSTLDAPAQFNATVNGGTWSADCGSCITSSGIFDPSSVVAGIYEICYTLGTGNCASNDCQFISVTEDCVEQFTSEDVAVCPETIVEFNGQQLTSPGTYPMVEVDQNGCDSTHTLFLTHFSVVPQHDFYSVCMGDSIEIEGIWYSDPEFIAETVLDNNGCSVTNTLTISLQDCTIPFYNVFIPNTFTPNNDNVNDLYTLSIEGGTLEYGAIINRWGEVVHEIDSMNLAWDGTTKQGFPVSDGVYTFLVKVRESYDGILHQYTGFVTVIR